MAGKATVQVVEAEVEAEVQVETEVQMTAVEATTTPLVGFVVSGSTFAAAKGTKISGRASCTPKGQQQMRGRHVVSSSSTK